MADEIQQQTKEPNFWQKSPLGVRIYIVFCVLVAVSMAWANHAGWFPTYGLFSGENSMHSSQHHNGYHGGGYTIHGK